MKQKYTAPMSKMTTLYTEEHLTQFIVSSHSVGENEGLAKPGFITDDEETTDADKQMTGFEPWGE